MRYHAEYFIKGEIKVESLTSKEIVKFAFALGIELNSISDVLDEVNKRYPVGKIITVDGRDFKIKSNFIDDIKVLRIIKP